MVNSNRIKNKNLNGNGLVKRTKYEPDESYRRRVWFVKKFIKNGGKDVEGIRLSNIWVNMILLKCRYSDELEKIVHKALKSMNGARLNNIRV